MRVRLDRIPVFYTSSSVPSPPSCPFLSRGTVEWPPSVQMPAWHAWLRRVIASCQLWVGPRSLSAAICSGWRSSTHARRTRTHEGPGSLSHSSVGWPAPSRRTCGLRSSRRAVAASQLCTVMRPLLLVVITAPGGEDEHNNMDGWMDGCPVSSRTKRGGGGAKVGGSQSIQRSARLCLDWAHIPWI